MKLSEEELDKWFIELPLFLKRIVFRRLKGFFAIFTSPYD